MYLYETHMHTSEASLCGRSSGAEMARFYAGQGYRGIIVTDHFFGGNTAVDRAAPWRAKVAAFCDGYFAARAEGERLGLDVFFGWEQTFEGDDYLVYGLGPDWLLEHPEAAEWTRAQQLAEVRRAGGCVVQAHPFRQREYLSRIRLGGRFVDAIEAVNAANDPISDACAWRYARSLGLPVTAGSDKHIAAEEPGRPLAGIELETPLESIGDYVRRIRARAPLTLHADPARLVPPEGESLYLECFSLDAEERCIPFNSIF